MLKTRTAALLTLGLFALLSVLSTPKADAKVACFIGAETIALTPNGVVTLDTLVVHRSPDSGLFEASLGTDAGSVAFDVNASTLAAPSNGCAGAAGTITVTTANPFAPDAGVLTFSVAQ